MINITKWKQNGLTVAGGNGPGNRLDQLNKPTGIYIDDDDNQTIYIVDAGNHRVMEWKSNATSGRVVAGGNKHGYRTNQLHNPKDVIIDKQTDSIIICDAGNRRVVRWSRQKSTNGEILMRNIFCEGITADNEGHFYISDSQLDEVRRWGVGVNRGTKVAGGYFQINKKYKASTSGYLYVDEDGSIYTSDATNHVVVKWTEHADKDIFVAGDISLTQLNRPMGIVVDHLGNVYVADANTSQVFYWIKGKNEGRVVVGENKGGSGTNQLKYPTDLSFDKEGNLYVVDTLNHRVQKFLLDTE